MEPQTATLVIGLAGIAGTLVGGIIGAVVAMKVSKREQQTTMNAISKQNEDSLHQLKYQLDVQVQMNAAQLKAQVELPERLRWQNDFRTTLAHLDSEVHHILMLGGPEDAPLTNEQKVIYKGATFHFTRLQLMLSPTAEKPDEMQQLELAIESLAERLLNDVKSGKWHIASQTRKRLINTSKQRLHKHWSDIRATTEAAKNLPTIP